VRLRAAFERLVSRNELVLQGGVALMRRRERVLLAYFVQVRLADLREGRAVAFSERFTVLCVRLFLL